MILGLFTLLTALSISGIAAYYSIVGLTAIFAAAYWPIVTMGAVLEVGKVMTTLWLHYNWERADWKIRSYLCAAVAVLMMITSMGIFGFLSKSHADQAIPSGDIAAQVSLFDEKIKTQRDNIESAKKALVQMDGSVDQMLARSTNENGATKAAAMRKAQAKERASLQKDIDDAQKEIASLQEQRAPIASQYRKVEAEVGPIKYIAAVIYGDKADQNLLEAAVRWVIMIIVFVFDPLAIILILAATTSIDWSKMDRRKRKHAAVEEAKEDALEAAALAQAKGQLATMDEAIVADMLATARQDAIAEVETELKSELARAESELESIRARLVTEAAERTQIESGIEELVGMIHSMTEQSSDMAQQVNALEENCSQYVHEVEKTKAELSELIKEYDALVEKKLLLDSEHLVTVNDLTVALSAIESLQAECDRIALESVATHSDLTAAQERITELESQLSVQREYGEFSRSQISLEPEFAAVLHENLWDMYETEPSAEEEQPAPEPEPEAVETPVDEVVFDIGVVDEPESPPTVGEWDAVQIPEEDLSGLPQLPSKTEIEMPPAPLPEGGNAGFGTTLPENPLLGDTFLRVDYSPMRLFKWDGINWIQVDKDAYDSYAFNEEYIKYLVSKVSTGEYDVDDLNDIEQEQIAQYLQNNS